MSLLFSTLSRFVIAFLPRSKCLLISWLQSAYAVILELKKRKSVTTSTFFLLWKWKWKSLSHVQLFVTHGLHTVLGILRTIILEWVAFPFSRGSSQPRDWTQVSCVAGRFFTSWATGKPLSPSICHKIIGPDAMILVFLIFSFKLALLLSSFTLIKSLKYVRHTLF